MKLSNFIETTVFCPIIHWSYQISRFTHCDAVIYVKQKVHDLADHQETIIQPPSFLPNKPSTHICWGSLPESYPRLHCRRLRTGKILVASGSAAPSRKYRPHRADSRQLRAVDINSCSCRWRRRMRKMRRKWRWRREAAGDSSSNDSCCVVGTKSVATSSWIDDRLRCST